MTPLVYFVRHGLTDWNAEGRLQGQAETGLNAIGRDQAAANGRRLAQLVNDPGEFDFVASPMRRTRQTMELIRSAIGLPAQGYATDPRLIELHFGDWQGFTLAELEAANPGCTAGRHADKWRFVPPGEKAESYELLARRVEPWLREVIRPTVCVTHGGVVRSMFYLIEGMPAERAANLDIPQDHVLELRGGRLKWI